MRRAGLLLLGAHLLVLLLAAPAIAAETPVERLVLRLSDPRLRGNAYRELLRRKDPKAIPILENALPFADIVGQHYGAIVLGVYRTKEAAAALRILAAKRDPHLRVCAGAALYRLGDKSAVLGMADALLTPGVDPTVRYQLIARVWAVKEPAIRSAVAGLLVPGDNVTVLGYALYALHSLEARKESAAAARLLKDPRLPIRTQAAALLFRYGREAHAGVVGEGVRAPLVYADWARVYAYLIAAGRCSPSILDAAGERVAVETDPTTLTQLFTLLTRYPHLPAAKSLRGRLEDPSERIASGAFRTLEATPAGLPAERLHEFLGAKSPMLRLRAAEALRRRDDAAGHAVALTLLGSPTPTVRGEAARILGGFLRDDSVEPLLDALLDPDRTVRARALASLTRILTRLFPYRRFQPVRAGYNAGAAPAASSKAVETIRRWWKANRAKDW